MVVETEEHVASDGRLGAVAGWPCGVQGMPPAWVFLGREGTGEKNPQGALAGLAGALRCYENLKQIKAFNV